MSFNAFQGKVPALFEDLRAEQRAVEEDVPVMKGMPDIFAMLSRDDDFEFEDKYFEDCREFCKNAGVILGASVEMPSFGRERDDEMNAVMEFVPDELKGLGEQVAINLETVGENKREFADVRIENARKELAKREDLKVLVDKYCAAAADGRNEALSLRDQRKVTAAVHAVLGMLTVAKKDIVAANKHVVKVLREFDRCKYFSAASFFVGTLLDLMVDDINEDESLVEAVAEFFTFFVRNDHSMLPAVFVTEFMMKFPHLVPVATPKVEDLDDDGDMHRIGFAVHCDMQLERSERYAQRRIHMMNIFAYLCFAERPIEGFSEDVLLRWMRDIFMQDENADHQDLLDIAFSFCKEKCMFRATRKLKNALKSIISPFMERMSSEKQNPTKYHFIYELLEVLYAEE